MALPSKKKISVYFILSSFTLMGILATKPPQEKEAEYKNLQVLSKKISERTWIM